MAFGPSQFSRRAEGGMEREIHTDTERHIERLIATHLRASCFMSHSHAPWTMAATYNHVFQQKDQRILRQDQHVISPLRVCTEPISRPMEAMMALANGRGLMGGVPKHCTMFSKTSKTCYSHNACYEATRKASPQGKLNTTLCIKCTGEL